jgi:ATP-dependent Clp protease ATP-binding subunit ClpB
VAPLRPMSTENTIIIMTSNIGSQFIQELGAGRRKKMAAAVMTALRANFKPEFLNRVDETIVFHNLNKEQIIHIVGIQLQRLAKRLAEQKIELTLSESAAAFLAEKGYDPVYGARPLKRAIQQYVENPLSMEILSGRLSPGQHLVAEVLDDGLVFKQHAAANPVSATY